MNSENDDCKLTDNGQQFFYHYYTDSRPPEVTINSFPILTREKDPIFSWTSNEEATFQCAIDNPRRLFNCNAGRTSTWRAPQLSDGEHTFYLVALDNVGNKATREKTFTVGECTFRRSGMFNA